MKSLLHSTAFAAFVLFSLVPQARAYDAKSELKKMCVQDTKRHMKAKAKERAAAIESYCECMATVDLEWCGNKCSTEEGLATVMFSITPAQSKEIDAKRAAKCKKP